MSETAVVELRDAERGVPLVRMGAARPDHAALRAAVSDRRAGAIVTFEGVTREVDALEYEAYVQMAAEQILELAARAVERHGACAAAVEHVVGSVALGEPSVVVVVSAPHRDQGFGAARAVIDELKLLVPIWKVERDGDERRRVEGAVPQVPR